ncbi:MAG: uracil phosphoribosyltransferase [Bacteroidota bacterium]
MDQRIKLISRHNSCLNQIVFELRAEKIQEDRLRFRNNMEKVGELLAYEISKELSYESQEVTTPLGTLDMALPSHQPVIVSILRAGVPLHNGLLRMFDKADNGFISAYRHHTKGNEFIVKVEYIALPEPNGRALILADPMIATGRSLVLSYKAIAEQSDEIGPVFVAGAIASEEGLEYVLRHIPHAKIYVAAIDNELTARGYIVPGLGDAGDLAFGPK